jgi:hypothetical protein
MPVATRKNFDNPILKSGLRYRVKRLRSKKEPAPAVADMLSTRGG